MKQVTDTGAIEAEVDEVIAANPDKVEQARPSRSSAGWFVGQVMKAPAARPTRRRSTQANRIQTGALDDNKIRRAGPGSCLISGFSKFIAIQNICCFWAKARP
jgi:hypothetical protein